MFILLTSFIHPIKRPIWLSKHYGFQFDNPRSREEIDAVRDLLSTEWDLNLDSFIHQTFPFKSEISEQELVTIDQVISEFVEKNYAGRSDIVPAASFDGTKESAIEFYAAHWVIVRFESPEVLKEEKAIQVAADKMRKKGNRGIFILEDDHIFMTRERIVTGFCAIVSLFATAGDEGGPCGWNLLETHSREEVKSYSPSSRLMQSILMNGLALKTIKGEGSYRGNFDAFYTETKQIIELFDDAFAENKIDEKIVEYVGEVLESIRMPASEYLSLTQLTGILELLLTHQPDSARFNVEDSITKQFVLKAAIAAHCSNNDLNLDQAKADLKLIYQQRSNIVHGNFLEVDKYVAKLRKNEKYFEELVSKCSMYVIYTLKLYTSKPDFVRFLKAN